MGQWRKYAGNPVLGGPEMGTCFDVFVMRQGGDYQMYFSWRPKKSIAVCRSADGVHWDEPEILLAPRPESGWEDDVNRNCVLYQDGRWHMWYTGQARGYSWIGYAVSDDGHRFRRASDQPVLFSERPFEGMSVMNPFVLWDEKRRVYRMWYSAGETYEPNVLCYAESSDGLNWKKLPANPIYVADKNNAWEQQRVGGCQLIRCGGWYYLFYIGYEDIHTARIGVARSKNGVTGWQRYRDNPIVSPAAGEWDADACYKPFALPDEESGCWLLWYNGRHENREYIGLVLHDGLDLGFEDV